MSPPPAPPKPYGWCAVLSAANDDDLGTALAEAFARHRVRSPELLEVSHYRHAIVESVGTAWFLFIAVVTGVDLDVDLADSHPALAREFWHLAERWTHSFPKFRKFAPGARALDRYHRPRPGVVLPAPPPERPRPSDGAVAPTPGRRVEPEAPKPAPAPAVPEQRGLF